MKPETWAAIILIAAWGSVVVVICWLWIQEGEKPQDDEYTGNEAGVVKHEAPKD